MSQTQNCTPKHTAETALELGPDDYQDTAADDDEIGDPHELDDEQHHLYGDNDNDNDNDRTPEF